MVGPCLENSTRSHTKGSTEIDTHMKKIKGRPKTTCGRYIIAELSDMGLTMVETQVIAQDRKRWRMPHMGMKRIRKK